MHDAANKLRAGSKEVEAQLSRLKSMVDEFSKFARLPNVRLELWDLDEVVRESAALYQGREEVAR